MSNVYAPTILGESGLVSYWRLGESSGTEAVDLKGANPGTYKGTPTLAEPGAIVGDPNAAVKFNGTSHYIEVPDSASLDLGDVFTYECWIKRLSTGAANKYLFERGSGSVNIKFTAEDKLLLRRDSVADITTSTVKITDTTTWHHVVVTKNGATAKIYIDGADVTGTVTNSTFANTATPLFIATEEKSFGWFPGWMDEIAIYNVAISAAQALDHYQKGSSAASCRSLLGVGR